MASNIKASCNFLIYSLLLILTTATTSESTFAQSSSTAFQVFLIGDGGAPKSDTSDIVLKLLQSKIEKAGENSAVIFLGDNIYPNGLPPVEFQGRTKAENRMKSQLNALKNYKGKIFMVPGNHDWKEGRRLGLTYVREEEKFVESYLNNSEVFFPEGGCPGPVEVALSEEITLVMIDTQWWLHPWDKPGEDSDCDSKDPVTFLANLEDILYRNKSKKIIVAAHHPLFSEGPHGGYFPFKYHIFPLTEVRKNLYIPFPVLGSLYPLYRGVLGSVQDLPHPKYKMLKKQLLTMFEDYPGLIYAAGHDHSLQFTIQDSLNHIISGAGSKITYVDKNPKDAFAKATKGFAEIIFKHAGADSVQFYGVGKDHGSEKIIFKTQLIAAQSTSQNISRSTIEIPDSITIEASNKYGAGKVKRFLMGDNYRTEWASKITVPVLKIAEEKGGLTITKKGGGMQTKSLRLEDSTGKEYVLRSIEKYPENAIPEMLRGSFAESLVQDQISASHPYAALAVSKLAESINIPHTHPKVVYIPDDPNLGIYQRDFANTLALYEERDPVDHSAENTKVKSTTKVLENLQEDNDNTVDQQAVLRARLFDLVVADWDRHDDQWRWMENKKKKNKIYSPLPRDRDQAFFVNEGILPKIASRKWAMPKIQGFDGEIRFVEGFMFNARYFDRTFLTATSKEDWITSSNWLKNNLTDSAIESALKDLTPDTGKTNEIIISKIKKRRDNIQKYALEYYQFLAREADVAGTDKNELFEVKRQEDGSTKITVLKISKKGYLEDTLYNKTFYPSETKEIRLYGIGGDDKFITEGHSEKAIKIRIIGGTGSDTITDESKIKGPAKNIIVYDTKEGNKIDRSRELRNLTSADPEVNNYNRKAFKYDLLAPLLSAQFNIDDGVFIGGGFLFKKHGFRKEPFSQRHQFTGNYAFNTSSYNFSYTGLFTDVIKKWDFLLDLDLRVPNYVNNFFGLGNETEYDDDIEIKYYRVRFTQIGAGAYFVNNLGKSQSITLGPHVSHVEVEENDDRFINNFPENQLDPSTTFDEKTFAGFRISYDADTRDNLILPTNGVRFNLQYDYLKNTEQSSFTLSQLQGSFAFYISFRLPARVTLASRFGGGVHLEDYEFYQANYLSGVTNLRGYRKTRFGGASSIYNNTELRLKLFSFRSYLFPATVGILGFNDVGRVWEPGESSSKWHNGAGGGAWIAPFNKIVVSLMMGFSEEKSVPIVKFGLMF